MTQNSFKKCNDCLAHYSEGYNHICPPWLKALVTFKTALRKAKIIEDCPECGHPEDHHSNSCVKVESYVTIKNRK